MDYRVEKDSLGEQKLPADTYYGVQTHRAIENFPITGVPISRFPSLIRALSCIKEAAATANEESDCSTKRLPGPSCGRPGRSGRAASTPISQLT